MSGRSDLHRGEWRERAPAKLTLSLAVTGVRADGYHLLEAEMVSLDLADELVFGPGDGLEIEDAGEVGELPPVAGNLVTRALAAVGRRAAVRLRKAVPVGAGLGGGSADAAAVLRWAVATGWEAPPDEVVRVAASLGSDVPFCLRNGRALVRGAGELVEPLPFEPRRFVLLVPPFGVSTAAVYRAFDALGRPASGRNDLEAAAIAVEPRLSSWLEAFFSRTGRRPVLAGSGSSLFVEAEPGDEALDGAVIELDGERARLRLVAATPA